MERTFEQEHQNIPPDRTREYKCPHCGQEFLGSELVDQMIPTHNFPKLCNSVCHGSGQHPRYWTDTRLLWKDQKDAE